MRHLLLILTLLTLTGCSGNGLFGKDATWFRRTPQAQPTQQVRTETPAVKPAPTPVAAPAQTLRIALLAPLSGQSQTLGQNLQDAALLAMSDKMASLPTEKQQALRIILIPKDTAAPGGAAAAAQAAVADGAKAVLGPLFSADVEAAAPILRQHNIPVISFSNNARIAGNGVYLLGFSPTQQMNRALTYAAAQGIRSIAALIPNDPYGVLVQESLKTASLAGMNVTAVATYPKEAPNLNTEIRQILAATRPIAAREGKTLGFDALLVPEGGERLTQAIVTLTSLGLDSQQLKLIGSGQWDDERNPPPPAATGGWIASSTPERRNAFLRHFQNTYGAPPERLATLAYDGMALLAALAYQNPENPLQNLTATKLTDPAGFNGPVDGLFRFLPNGLNERGLAILQTQGTGFHVIDPAPTYFGK